MYDPLREWLSRQPGNEITVSFNQLEQVLGFQLPRSATRYPSWWDNEDVEDTRHVQCKAWLGAGFNALRPNFLDRKVIFVRRQLK